MHRIVVRRLGRDQHAIVRILLWRAGAMPWNYARFLDYAAEELNFLQKVGGGYMFLHRYLLGYFASLDQPGYTRSVDGRAESPNTWQDVTH